MPATTGQSPSDGSPPASDDRPRSRDHRQLIPVLGLREYWYPATLEKKVGWRKPLLVTMLGDDVCLFRGKSGQVVAVDNACPHRNAMLSKGHCDFKGYVTCFYHGMTFDERGECVAAFGEGPLSPMPGKLRVRVYPTVTLKGIVFVWMGSGDPAPLEESIPEDFFDRRVMLFSWTNTWPCNWRPAVENYADSHTRYVHRNSALMLMRPVLPPALPMQGRPFRVGAHRLVAPGRIGNRGNYRKRAEGQEYRELYPLLGARWPKHRWRLLWAWFFRWADETRYHFRPAYQVSDEWGPGQHLPSLVRLNYGTHMYTRWAIPVTEHQTRMFYFHAAKRGTWLGRVHERLQWALFHNWAMNKNFSEQDSPGAIQLYYDRRERMTVSDQQTIEWRKMVLSARGMPAQPEPTEGSGSQSVSANGNGHQAPAKATGEEQPEALAAQP